MIILLAQVVLIMLLAILVTVSVLVLVASFVTVLVRVLVNVRILTPKPRHVVVVVVVVVVVAVVAAAAAAFWPSAELKNSLNAVFFVFVFVHTQTGGKPREIAEVCAPQFREPDMAGAGRSNQNMAQ